MTPRGERQMRLRALAAAAERRNRPTPIVVVALIVLAVAVLFAGWSFTAAQAAERDRRRQARTMAEIEALVVQIEDAERAAAEGVDRTRYRTDPQLLTKLAAIAPRLAMTERPTINESTSRTQLNADSPISARVVTVRMNQVRIEDALEWLNQALEAVNGLFVSRIRMIPSANGWSVELDLARWEASR
ncbi:MAG: hypothetical protein VYC34_02815 [Planctomycetota bacterium]|nr:hypothetical protein [Planctomycetota bacterium]